MRLLCPALTKHCKLIIASVTLSILLWFQSTLPGPEPPKVKFIEVKVVEPPIKVTDAVTQVTSLKSIYVSQQTSSQVDMDMLLEQHNKFQLSPFLTGPFKPAFTPEEKKTMLQVVSIFHDLCMANNFTYFLYGGSLLGSYRHHDLIPWDDDIDVIVDWNQLDSLTLELSRLAPDYLFFQAGPRLKFYSSKSRRTSEYPWNWPYLDVSFFLQNNTHIWDSSEEFSSKYIYPKSIIFPVHLRPLANLYLNSPHDAYRNLKLTYTSFNCESHFYSHKLEARVMHRKATMPCKALANVLGFVHRSKAQTSGIKETLKIGHRVIHTQIVDEPPYAITKPFSYELIEKKVVSACKGAGEKLNLTCSEREFIHIYLSTFGGKNNICPNHDCLCWSGQRQLPPAWSTYSNGSNEMLAMQREACNGKNQCSVPVVGSWYTNGTSVHLVDYQYLYYFCNRTKGGKATEFNSNLKGSTSPSKIAMDISPSIIGQNSAEISTIVFALKASLCVVIILLLLTVTMLVVSQCRSRLKLRSQTSCGVNEQTQESYNVLHSCHETENQNLSLYESLELISIEHREGDDFVSCPSQKCCDMGNSHGKSHSRRGFMEYEIGDISGACFFECDVYGNAGQERIILREHACNPNGESPHTNIMDISDETEVHLYTEVK